MAETTYYYDVYHSGPWVNPANMVDGNLETFAYTYGKGDIQWLTGNTCPGIDLGTIIKVELRAYGYGDGNDRTDLRGYVGPIQGPWHELTMPASAGWTLYADITNNFAPWSWENVASLTVDIKYTSVGKSNTIYCAKVEIRVTYWAPPVADIDVGAIPIDRGSYLDTTFITRIDKNNPANASGILHSIKIYAVGDITGLRVGTFYRPDPGNYPNKLRCRDSAFIGDVAAGAERTFTGLSIAVEAGDYIGFYHTGGSIEADFFGFEGNWWVNGEYIDPGDEAECNSWNDWAISLYGYGDIEEPPPAYYHGLNVQGVGELALCDVGNHPLRIRKGGTTYGIELVATDDPNASRIRVRTGVGIKAVRKYT